MTIELVSQYFEREGFTPEQIATARIAQTSRSGVGWVDCDRPATIEEARKLKAKGVTAVAVKLGTRIADFSVGEIFRFAERPLFGGRVI